MMDPAVEVAAPLEQSPRVLVVEDDAVNRRVAALMLERRGYRVEVASSGEEAVAMAERGEYAAVLMDCHMPRLDGFEATARIRAHERRAATEARVPIIAMTASAGPDARARCIDAGMDDYVSKPISAGALDEVLQRWVEKMATDAPAHPTAKPPAHAVDLGMLRQIRGALREGEPDFLAEVIDIFRQDAPRRLAEIRAAVERGDAKSAGLAAHTLKGAAGNLGARALVAACARFEQGARAGETLGIDAIDAALDHVLAALEHEIT